MKGPFKHFEKDYPGLSVGNAYALANACDLAYKDDVSAGLTWGFTESRLFSVGSDQALVLYDSFERVMVIAFRGTEVTDFGDLKRDVDIRKVPGPLAAQFHKGFFEAFENVWGEENDSGSMVRFVKDRLATASVFLTGHSLGAAMATVCAARVIGERLINDFQATLKGLYTFGSPRVGDSWLRKNLEPFMQDRIHRFVNNNDIVTEVPLRKHGFVHVGEMMLLTEGGTLIRDPSVMEIWQDKLHGAANDFGEKGLDGVKDHSLLKNGEGYIMQLRKVLDAQ